MDGELTATETRTMGDKRADRVIAFLELLKLTDDFYGKPFRLLPWQREVVRDVYGTVTPDGLRQYKYAYLEIPKKQGKSTLVGGLSLAHLVCDPPGGQIYYCAADREQASIVYRAAKSMVEQEPALGKRIKVLDSTKTMINRETGTNVKVLSAEAYTKHGLNPSVIIFDELHAQPNRDLWDVMTYGSMSARTEPLLWVITTAGDDPDRKSIGWEQHELARKLIAGDLVDPTMYARIYGADDEADIYDERVWWECNPSLGVTIKIDTLRAEAARAQQDSAAEKLFRWLRLNQWVQLKRLSWLPLPVWDASERVENWRELLRGQRCYCGIDLSAIYDLTAFALLFPPTQKRDKWVFFIDTFCPAEKIRERSERDKVPYEDFAREGFLIPTPGNVIDYGFLAQHLKALSQLYNIEYYCADPWRLEDLRQRLPEELQNRTLQIKQDIAGMSGGVRKLEELFGHEAIVHGRNPLGRWSFGNTMVAIDGNENKKPMKNRSIERIDPIVALINAAAGADKLEAATPGYEQRGMRSLLDI